MVTSVARFSPGMAASARPAAAEPASRSLAEAQRLLLENHVTGADATRILSLVTQAESKIGQGQTVDASRIARDALKQARETVKSVQPEEAGDSPPAAGTSATGSPSTPEGNEETQVGEAVGSEGSPVFRRDTTSYSDGSGDAGVSFQYAQPLSSSQAFFAVKQHELSHVARDTRNAILNGQRVIASAGVISRIDPATGERVIEGGRARIVVFPNIELKHPTRETLGSQLDVTG